MHVPEARSQEARLQKFVMQGDVSKMLIRVSYILEDLEAF